MADCTTKPPLSKTSEGESDMEVGQSATSNSLIALIVLLKEVSVQVHHAVLEKVRVQVPLPFVGSVHGEGGR